MPLIERASAMALCAAVFAAGLEAQGIKTVPSIPSVADSVVTGACSDYQAALASHGAMQATGATHPGRCQFSAVTPLFDGQVLDDYWAAVTQGASRPFRRTVRPSTSPVGTCATATGLTLTLSARVDVSRLQWSGSQAVGAACVDEWNRVNPAVLAPANGPLSRADAIVTRIARTLGASPSVTACVANRIPGAAARALDAKVKALLQDMAVREQRLWMQAEPAVDPTAGACMPHCGLCSSGWVGTITCTKAVTGPYNYHHQETQTWSVGGNSTQAGGQTIYPTEWTAVGSGGKSTQTWVVNATGAGQLAVFSNSTGITFSRVNSQISVFNGIQATPPPSYTEFEYQFQPFTGPTGSTQVTGSNTRTTAGCETPVTPGSSTCTVACTWKMTLQ